MKKLSAALAAAALSLSLSFSAAQAQSLPPPTLAAKSWLLLDATSGQIIAADRMPTCASSRPRWSS